MAHTAMLLDYPRTGAQPWFALRNIIETGLFNIVFAGPEEMEGAADEALQPAAWDRAWHAAEYGLRLQTYEPFHRQTFADGR